MTKLNVAGKMGGDAIFGDDGDSIDISASGGIDLSGIGDAVASAANVAGQVAKVTATAVKVTDSITAVANTANAVQQAQAATRPRPGAPPPPRAVVQAHANNIVAAAQQHVAAFRPAQRKIALHLRPVAHTWRPWLLAAAGMAVAGGGAWALLIKPGLATAIHFAGVGLGAVVGGVGGYELGAHIKA